MSCPKCYATMIEMDDNGGGWKGSECPVCGYQELNADEPCPSGDGKEPCYPVDNEHGTGQECGCCGRDLDW